MEDFLTQRLRQSMQTHRSSSAARMTVVYIALNVKLVYGFALQQPSPIHTAAATPPTRSKQSPKEIARCHGLRMVVNDDEFANRNSFDDFGEEDLPNAGVLIDDLIWRVEKLRLEESNTRRFLKAKPVYLPYEECSKWVQAFSRWTTEEDWYVCRVWTGLSLPFCYDWRGLFHMLCACPNLTFYFIFVLHGLPGRNGSQWERKETRTFRQGLMNTMVV